MSFVVTRSAKHFDSGIQDLQMLKTADSGFAGFIKDNTRRWRKRTIGCLVPSLQRLAVSGADIDFNQDALRSPLAAALYLCGAQEPLGSADAL